METQARRRVNALLYLLSQEQYETLGPAFSAFPELKEQAALVEALRTGDVAPLE
jgi:hypothetical protein